MHSKLFTRLALSISLLLIFSLFTFGYLLVNDAQQQFLNERLQQVKGQTVSLANGSLDGLISKDYELLENWLHSVMSAKFYAYAFLSSPAGKIISHSDISKIGHDIKYQEIQDFNTIKSSHLNRPVKEVIFPVIIGNKTIANAHLAYYMDDVISYSDSTAYKMVLALFLFLLLLLGAVLAIVKHFINPLTELTDVITATSLDSTNNDKLKAELLNRDDETGILASEFQKMIRRLQESYRSLQNEEQRLKAMVKVKTIDLQKTNKELEAFSYSVSHDLRAPLRNINGYSDALIEDYSKVLDDTAINYLNRIQSGVQRMDLLILSLLKLSKINRSELNKISVNISLMIKNSIEQWQKQNAKKNTSISIAKNIMVYADPILLSSVVENLISNAFKYSSKTKNPKFEFFCDDLDGEIIYAIKDNGAGFDMKFAEYKLFGTFQRLHNDKEFEGTGIGLATVQRIIHLHQGRIWAEAEVDKGACFYFTLPSEN